ncbi:peptidase M16 domain-containing protein [Alicyclobacillus hesperidum URH17-3-68]|nr:peptidase M16 domain-containing protein [Alicyclobacillus hesperidum URH17-3-68]
MMSKQADLLKLTVTEHKLANGLEVCLMPKPNFHQTFAMFATKYGSIDNEFVIDGKRRRVPDGIAHFLEHKMFEDEHVDVFAQFAAHGASVNAFTTFDETAYYFSCTSDVKDNLNILLDFVQRIYLTDENVEKEKGIIAQEIRMGDDNPDRRAFMELLAAMYQKHPVRIDIAGSVESIYEITKSDLLDCYSTFYHPSNMVLVVVGGFDAKEMLEWIEQNQSRKTFGKAPVIERVYPSEPEKPGSPRQEVHLSVTQPRCLIGWKEPHGTSNGRDLLHQEMLTGVLLDVLFGKTSSIYTELLDAGLIDKGFSWEYELTEHYGYTVVGGNSPDPYALADRIARYVADTRNRGIDADAFERARKKAIGRFIMSLDQNAYLAKTYLTYRLRGASFLDTVDALTSLSLADANRRLDEHLREESRVVSLILSNQATG